MIRFKSSKVRMAGSPVGVSASPLRTWRIRSSTRSRFGHRVRVPRIACVRVAQVGSNASCLEAQDRG